MTSERRPKADAPEAAAPEDADAPDGAVEADGEAEATPEPVDPGNWQPTIVEPAPEPTPEEEAAANAPARPVLPEGDATVVYRGFADLVGPVVIDGVSYSFRPDQPVTVPSAVAEEVLTWPSEPFELLAPTTED